MTSTSALPVRTHGTGPDLALLHGWGFDGNVWGEFSQLLEKHFRVHRVDLPGHGHSHGVRFAGLQAVAEQVARVIPLGSTVCGWSLGGLVALQLALSDPARAARLVLVATTPCFVARDDWDSGMPVQTFDGFRESLADDGDRALRRFAGLVAAGSANHRERHRHLASMATPAGKDRTGLDAALAILLDTDLRADLAAVTAPTLVIQGGRDGLVPAAAAQWIAGHVGTRDARGPRARLELLPDASHAPFLDAPERVASLISAWHG